MSCSSLGWERMVAGGNGYAIWLELSSTEYHYLLWGGRCSTKQWILSVSAINRKEKRNSHERKKQKTCLQVQHRFNRGHPICLCGVVTWKKKKKKSWISSESNLGPQLIYKVSHWSTYSKRRQWPVKIDCMWQTTHQPCLNFIRWTCSPVQPM